MAQRRKHNQRSTYARLLQPGEKFWAFGGELFKVNRVDHVDQKKNAHVPPEDEQYKVFVVGRRNALVFGRFDRVELF